MKLTGKQIMIIDDDELIRVLLTRILESTGCKVHAAESIKDALRELKTFFPDLVILDLTMPDHDGFTFLKFRRQNHSLSHIPVMVLSGTTDRDDVQQAFEMGADQFLLKPFETRVIIQKLKYIFSLRADIVYNFPETQQPVIETEIPGHIIGHLPNHLKIESQVKLGAGKAVVLSPEDFIKHKGSPVVCKVENRKQELDAGFFSAVLNVTGLDDATKALFEEWQRTLSS